MDRFELVTNEPILDSEEAKLLEDLQELLDNASRNKEYIVKLPILYEAGKDNTTLKKMLWLLKDRNKHFYFQHIDKSIDPSSGHTLSEEIWVTLLSKAEREHLIQHFTKGIIVKATLETLSSLFDIKDNELDKSEFYLIKKDPHSLFSEYTCRLSGMRYTIKPLKSIEYGEKYINL